MWLHRVRQGLARMSAQNAKGPAKLAARLALPVEAKAQ
jgi:hypothetical protein